MFKVLIGLEEVDRTESLAEACRMFISKVQETIKNGGISEFALYEGCMIESEVDGVRGIMNFDAIRDFSYSIGVLRENGKLSDKPVPYIPKDIAKQVFMAANNDSWDAFLDEKKEILHRLAAAHLKPEESEQEPQIII